MSGSAEGGPGVFDSLRRLLGTLLGIAHNRLELFLAEVEEARNRLLALLLWGAAIVLCALMALLSLSVMVIILVPAESRPAVLLGMTLLYLTLAGVAAWRLKVRLQQWTAFPASLGELRKDREWLEQDG